MFTQKLIYYVVYKWYDHEFLYWIGKIKIADNVVIYYFYIYGKTSILEVDGSH